MLNERNLMERESNSCLQKCFEIFSSKSSDISSIEVLFLSQKFNKILLFAVKYFDSNIYLSEEYIVYFMNSSIKCFTFEDKYFTEFF